jgi:hypothetical protein
MVATKRYPIKSLWQGTGFMGAGETSMSNENDPALSRFVPARRLVQA